MTPQWITQERKTQLVKLQQRYRGLCLKEHAFCPVQAHYQLPTPHTETVALPVRVQWKDTKTGGIRRDKTSLGFKPVKVTVWEWELANLADAKIEDAIADWKAEDRDTRVADWKREQQAIHAGEKGRFGSRFDPVARDVFMAQRPEFYLTATGMDGVHARPVAVVRVPSTDKVLYVDVSAAFAKSTKGQRRHARRHGKLVQEVTVEELCQQAVRAWLTKRR